MIGRDGTVQLSTFLFDVGAAISTTNTFFALTASSLPVMLDTPFETCIGYNFTNDGSPSRKLVESFSHRTNLWCSCIRKYSLADAKAPAQVSRLSSVALQNFNSKVSGPFHGLVLRFHQYLRCRTLHQPTKESIQLSVNPLKSRSSGGTQKTLLITIVHHGLIVAILPCAP